MQWMMSSKPSMNLAHTTWHILRQSLEYYMLRRTGLFWSSNVCIFWMWTTWRHQAETRQTINKHIHCVRSVCVCGGVCTCWSSADAAWGYVWICVSMWSSSCWCLHVRHSQSVILMFGVCVFNLFPMLLVLYVWLISCVCVLCGGVRLMPLALRAQ